MGIPKIQEFSLIYKTNYIAQAGITLDWELMNVQTFVKLAKAFIPGAVNHYNYDSVTSASRRSKVTIYCNKCETYFKTSVVMHLLYGKGCPCKKSQYQNRRRTVLHNYFKKKLLTESNPNYVYSYQDIFDDSDVAEVYCVKHKSTFSEKKSNIVDGVFRCPICHPIQSNGELQVEAFLTTHSIPFLPQWTGFQDDPCINHDTYRKLRFDFYIPSHNIAIEYDGAQHFIPVEYWGGKQALKTQQALDAIKTQYCIDKQITLLRIPYTTTNIHESLSISLRKIPL